MMDYLYSKTHPKAAFEKANKVINSCENALHTFAARKFINLFFTTHKEEDENFFLFRMYDKTPKDSEKKLLVSHGATQRILRRISVVVYENLPCETNYFSSELFPTSSSS